MIIDDIMKNAKNKKELPIGSQYENKEMTEEERFIK